MVNVDALSAVCRIWLINIIIIMGLVNSSTTMIRTTTSLMAPGNLVCFMFMSVFLCQLGFLGLQLFSAEASFH